MTVLGLRCSVGFSLVVDSEGYFFLTAKSRLLNVVASIVSSL